MKIKYIFICAATLLLSFSCNKEVPENKYEKDAVYTQFYFGEIKPAGWLKQQMEHDMEGFIGNLDNIVPDLVNDPIYSTGRLHSKSKAKELGNLKAGDIGDDEQYKWWNSETQSNWWDGYIRHALMLGNETYLNKVSAHIKAILATQDEDGYLGIYTPDTRYKFTSENGEFWAKATLYRYILAYYEVTKDKVVWDALLRAVDNVMANYPVNASDPFNVGDGYSGGTAHGLVFTDVLDRLYQLTGEMKYRDYALFMYRNYSDNFSFESDAQLKNVLNPDYKNKCHAVHTYEHLRPIILAEYASDELKKDSVIDKYLVKIRRTTTLAGGAIGDEWIGERTAAAENTGYEYCSQHELVDSYSVLMQKRGDKGLGNLIENIFYNASMGARHPHHSSIAYLKTDNSYQMDGTRNGQEEHHAQTRYKYSPVHQDVAVCCVPNAGRITPYFLQRSWMKEGENTLVANILAPNVLNTEIKGTKIQIENKTEYPYSNDMAFVITVDKPLKTKIKIRRPEWATDVRCPVSYTTEGEFLVFEKEFSGSETINLSFVTSVRVLKSDKNEHYFAYGALVYARPIEASESEGRKYTDEYVDLFYKSVDNNRYEFIEANEAAYNKSEITVNLKNKTNGKVEQVTLIPLSKTILRQTAF
ncbi:beta-L-arabinofuranosidase domain-containing protein [Dysgonomonas sp. UBA7698]|uniref:beta-L-arabinofuranosidase domain-containing protein n=1 Tax=Dysgonomonas sp. UBA7698 TaxID=1946427 RepID=UPI0025C4C79E|nr:beta-L-arabinofuranosidase domain-containing protein [Dysgonomonas sp. UBA7698]